MPRRLVSFSCSSKCVSSSASGHSDRFFLMFLDESSEALSCNVVDIKFQFSFASGAPFAELSIFVIVPLTWLRMDFEQKYSIKNFSRGDVGVPAVHQTEGSHDLSPVLKHCKLIRVWSDAIPHASLVTPSMLCTGGHIGSVSSNTDIAPTLQVECGNRRPRIVCVRTNINVKTSLRRRDVSACLLFYAFVR